MVQITVDFRRSSRPNNREPKIATLVRMATSDWKPLDSIFWSV